MKTSSQIESMLYNHFNKIENIENYKILLKGILNNIEIIKELKVKSSFQNTNKLPEELIYKFEIKRKIRNIQKQIDDVEVRLEQLNENDIQLIDFIYKYKMSYKVISDILYFSTSTVGRKKEKLIEQLKYVI